MRVTGRVEKLLATPRYRSLDRLLSAKLFNNLKTRETIIVAETLVLIPS
jgi:hypothetical protein